MICNMHILLSPYFMSLVSFIILHLLHLVFIYLKINFRELDKLRLFLNSLGKKSTKLDFSQTRVKKYHSALDIGLFKVILRLFELASIVKNLAI